MSETPDDYAYEIASADIVLPLSASETQILHDLLDNDRSELSQLLGYNLDAIVQAQLLRLLKVSLADA